MHLGTDHSEWMSGEVPEPGLGDPTQLPGVNPLVADSEEIWGRLEDHLGGSE